MYFYALGEKWYGGHMICQVEQLKGGSVAYFCHIACLCRLHRAINQFFKKLIIFWMNILRTYLNWILNWMVILALFIIQRLIEFWISIYDQFFQQMNNFMNKCFEKKIELNIELNVFLASIEYSISIAQGYVSIFLNR